MHCASLAVEDGVVLGRLFARIRSRDQITQLLDAFQDLRQDRTNSVLEFEWTNKALMELPYGEIADGRDAALAAAEERRKAAETGQSRWTDDELAEQWGKVGRIYAYHAGEAVDDWYTKWGTLTKRKTKIGSSSPGDSDSEVGGLAYNFAQGVHTSVVEVTTS